MILAIKAGLLIDGNGGDPIKDAVVLVEGKTIIAVGPGWDSFLGRVSLSLVASARQEGFWNYGSLPVPRS